MPFQIQKQTNTQTKNPQNQTTTENFKEGNDL